MKCNCFATRKEIRYTYCPLTGRPIPNEIDAPVCLGTKEIDRCDCLGMTENCDFYPEKRQKKDN